MTDPIATPTRRVWVIEDNPDHAVLIASQLELVPQIAGVTVTPDGEQALHWIEAWPQVVRDEMPGMVLLDLELPRVDGADVLRALRASTAWRAVPVVVLTTSAMPSDRETCLKIGADAYLTKGSDLPRLADRVRPFMSHWRH